MTDSTSQGFSQEPEITPTRLTTEWKINEYIIASLVCISVPFILSSNVMVVTSVAKYKRLQIPTNYFITSLAIADIVVAFALPFYVVVELMPVYIYNDYVCLASNRVLTAAGGVSILTLAIIAFDRYTAIMNPLEYISLMTSRKIIGCILFSWIYSAAVSWTPVFIGWHAKIADHSYLCTSAAFQAKSDLLFLFALFIPACLGILFCYFRIYFVARHHAKAIAAAEQTFKRNLEQHFRRTDTKYAKTLAVLIGVFLCLWLPHQTCASVKIIYGEITSHWVRNYLMLLAFLNSGVNPWVYAYQNSDFRAAYKKMSDSWKTLCKCRRGRHEVEYRRESIVSCISVVPNSLIRLNRINSRIIASDILYALSQHVGDENMETALGRRMSAKHTVVNAVSSLPELLKMYANTYPDKCSDIQEESVIEDTKKTNVDSRDSAVSLTDFESPERRGSAGVNFVPTIIHVEEAALTVCDFPQR